MTELKLAICIPSRDTWKADFGLSLVMATIAFCEMTKFMDNQNVAIRFCHTKGSHLAGNRNELVKQAIDTNCSHILWLDDDHQFPMETVYKLWKRDLDIVGANCATKSFPSMPTARIGLDRVHTTEKSEGLQEVTRLGTGVLMVKTDVYKNISFPYFACPEDPEFEGNPMGEDVYFIKKAVAQGYKVFVDHDVSKNVDHIGDFAYNHRHMDEWNGVKVVSSIAEAA